MCKQFLLFCLSVSFCSSFSAHSPKVHPFFHKKLILDEIYNFCRIVNTCHLPPKTIEENCFLKKYRGLGLQQQNQLYQIIPTTLKKEMPYHARKTNINLIFLFIECLSMTLFVAHKHLSSTTSWYHETYKGPSFFTSFAFTQLITFSFTRSCLDVPKEKYRKKLKQLKKDWKEFSNNNKSCTNQLFSEDKKQVPI